MRILAGAQRGDRRGGRGPQARRGGAERGVVKHDPGPGRECGLAGGREKNVQVVIGNQRRRRRRVRRWPDDHLPRVQPRPAQHGIAHDGGMGRQHPGLLAPADGQPPVAVADRLGDQDVRARQQRPRDVIGGQLVDRGNEHRVGGARGVEQPADRSRLAVARHRDERPVR